MVSCSCAGGGGSGSLPMPFVSCTDIGMLKSVNTMPKDNEEIIVDNGGGCGRGVIMSHYTSLGAKNTIPLPLDLQPSEVSLAVTVAQGSMSELLYPKLIYRARSKVEEILCKVYTAKQSYARCILKVKILMISDGTIRGTLSAMEHRSRISEPMVALCYQIVSNNNDGYKSNSKESRDKRQSKFTYNSDFDDGIADDDEQQHRVYQGGLTIFKTKLPYEKCLLDMTYSHGANEIVEKIAPKCAHNIIDRLNIGCSSKFYYEKKQNTRHHPTTKKAIVNSKGLEQYNHQ